MEREPILQLLKALSDKRCLDILNIISAEPSYTGELALHLKIKESRISEKIKILKSAGLITEEWKREGNKLVKYLKPSMRKINISLDGGLSVETISDKPKEIVDYEHAEYNPPSVRNFVGRKDEYKFLKDNDHILITGIPGIGKSAMAAHFVNTQKMNTFWHDIRETDNLKHLLIKMAIFLQRLGDDSLINSLQADRDRRMHVNLAIAGMRKTGSILVLDDVHKCKDAEIFGLINDFLQSVPEVKVILAARSRIPIVATSLKTLVLGELPPAEARKLVGDESKTVVKRVGGHPLLLKIMSNLPVSLGEGTRTVSPDEYVMNVILPSLPKGIATVIQKLSFFRGEVKREDAEFIFGKFNSDEFHNAENIGLLRSKNGTVSMNDLVREAAYLSADNKEDVHSKLATFYISKNSSESKIEGFHHLWKSKRNEDILKFLDQFAMQLIDSGHMNNFQKELIEASDSMAVCEAKAATLYWTGRSYRNSRMYKEALEFFSRAKLCPHSSDLEMRIAPSEAVVLQYMGRIEAARDILEGHLSALKERGGIVEGDILNTLGRSLTYLGEMNEAEKVLKRSLEIFSNFNESRGYWVCLFNIAFLDYVKGDLQEAWAKNEKAASGFLNMNYLYGYVATQQTKAFIMESTGRTESAIEKYDEVIDILENLGFSQSDLAFTLMRKTLASTRIGRMEEARKDLAKSKNIISQTEDELLKGMLSYVEGSFLLKRKRLELAEAMLKKAMKYESGDPIMLWGVRLELAKLLSVKGKKRDAEKLILDLIKDLEKRSFNIFLQEAKDAHIEIAANGKAEM
ncbi:MAG: ArsR family transcriptional regulator [Thermoplasmata archaeon]